MIETVQSAPAIGSLAVQDLPPEELRTIRLAAERLRRSRGVVVRAADLLAGILGPVASLGLRQLSVSPALIGKVQGVAEAALRRAFDVAIVGVAAERRSRFGLGDRGSRWFAAASGAVTGFTGIAGFLPDVTVVTLLIMRRIAMIAVEEGEDLSTPEARAACLEVFALDLAGPSDGRPERAETELGTGRPASCFRAGPWFSSFRKWRQLTECGSLRNLPCRQCLWSAPQGRPS